MKKSSLSKLQISLSLSKHRRRTAISAAAPDAIFALHEGRKLTMVQCNAIAYVHFDGAQLNPPATTTAQELRALLVTKPHLIGDHIELRVGLPLPHRGLGGPCHPADGTVGEGACQQLQQPQRTVLGSSHQLPASRRDHACAAPAATAAPPQQAHHSRRGAHSVWIAFLCACSSSLTDAFCFASVLLRPVTDNRVPPNSAIAVNVGL